VGSVKDAAAGDPPETRRSGFLTKKTKTMVSPALSRFRAETLIFVKIFYPKNYAVKWPSVG
jgi:hypothetical protein